VEDIVVAFLRWCWYQKVKRAIQEHGNIPILAAGGIATGEQMAGVMAMGADGVWCASVFLPTKEAETSEVIKEKNGECFLKSNGKISQQNRETFKTTPVCLDRCMGV
jgi:NAD(P)H-dependent flavin oxidoreductase YrpB (nitropropane dioxygenase family)